MGIVNGNASTINTLPGELFGEKVDIVCDPTLGEFKCSAKKENLKRHQEFTKDPEVSCGTFRGQPLEALQTELQIARQVEMVNHLAKRPIQMLSAIKLKSTNNPDFPFDEQPSRVNTGIAYVRIIKFLPSGRLL
jgi:hypothetical protein